MRVVILYNAPTLPAEHPDYASEAGVLESVHAIQASVCELGWDCALAGLRSDVANLWQSLANLRADVVVNLCESFAGQSRHEAHVTALLELLNVPYTGSPPECMSLVQNKARAKRLLAGTRIPTAAFWHVGRNETLPNESLTAALANGPLFIKPANEDASLGISAASVVVDWPALAQQAAAIQRQYGDILIETYLPGREFNVGVISLPDWQTLPLAEIEFVHDVRHPWPIVTYDSKWDGGSSADLATPARCPANVAPELAPRIRAIALQAAQVTGCRDYARVDLRLDSAGNPHVLEVNANPDLSPTAGFARGIAEHGWNYTHFVRRLLETAAQRSPREDPHRQPVHLSTPMSPRRSAITIRELRGDDKPALLDALRACEMFRPDEIEVADEVLSEAFRDGPSGDYQVRVAETDGRAVGWSAYGLVPLTDATYDLYWIAVHPDFQRHGVGRSLLDDCATQLRAKEGRWLLAETSDTASYDKTRAFYLRTGFTVVGDVPDFYRPKDGRVTYGRRMDEPK